MKKIPFDDFYSLLTEAQQDRELLPVDYRYGKFDTPYWNTWEMLTMMREVNRRRRRAGMELVSWEDIEHEERQAAGHIDYTKKFALYCAELAVGRDRNYY